MGAAAIGILFGGYSLTLWGYCLVRGYNVSLADLVNPLRVYTWKHPMPLASNTAVIPTGTPADSASHSVSTSAAVTSGTALSGGPATGAQVSSSRAIHAAAAPYGWGQGGQWNALTRLVKGESRGDPQARNPSSGALGIGQALGHGTGCSGGSLGNEYGPQYGLSCADARAANSGDGYQQSRWMMGYIRKVYRNPASAYAAWLSRDPHWY